MLNTSITLPAEVADTAFQLLTLKGSFDNGAIIYSTTLIFDPLTIVVTFPLNETNDKSSFNPNEVVAVVTANS